MQHNVPASSDAAGAAPPAPGIRLIRLRELVEQLGVAPSTIWRWEAAGRFPRRVRLGANSVAWRLDEVEAWLEARQRANEPTRRPSPNPRARGGVSSAERQAPPRQTKRRNRAKLRRQRARGGR